MGLTCVFPLEKPYSLPSGKLGCSVPKWDPSANDVRRRRVPQHVSRRREWISHFYVLFLPFLMNSTWTHLSVFLPKNLSLPPSLSWTPPFLSCLLKEPPQPIQMSRTQGASVPLSSQKGTWWVSLFPLHGFLPAQQWLCQPFWVCLLSKCSNKNLPGQITISE